MSSVAMGLGYLTRYESGAAALAAIVVVAVASLVRATGTRKQRVRVASCDTLVYALPPAAAFIGWAVVSYVITGHAFEQFQSQYGNSSQVGIVGKFFTAKALGMPLPVFGGIQLLAYAPLLPLLLVVALAVSWTRRRPESARSAAPRRARSRSATWRSSVGRRFRGCASTFRHFPCHCAASRSRWAPSRGTASSALPPDGRRGRPCHRRGRPGRSGDRHDRAGHERPAAGFGRARIPCLGALGASGEREPADPEGRHSELPVHCSVHRRAGTCPTGRSSRTPSRRVCR